ncbi:SusC/RagA family TonB-linked outer membrane protein [Eisenibacter elegans]|uniref:SusC/RagA family TonB-linked outer membrane protein n=1 Tax=Eisenibacter elegans TaxID=997 RepID=UPI0003FD5D18|nr:TonB-dependent receptor [Eisenibacter elegans]
MKKGLLLSLTLLLSFLYVGVFAQGRLSGVVTDDKGEGLPGVTITIKGTTQGTATDINGRYSLSVPANAILVFRAVGMESQEISVGGQSTLDVSMAPSVQQLQDIVVVAYGSQQKKELTGAVSSVGSEQLKDLPLLGIEQGLQGRAAGVQVTQNSGTPGSGIAVRVRGPSSISASNEPLYVVDGVPINQGNYSNIGVGNQQTNALANINPSEIESMEVLKDAAATALYGSRASNGVVLITTKRGKVGRSEINVNYYTGIQETWKRLTPLTGPQQVELYNEMFANRLGLPIGSPAAINTAFNFFGSLNPNDEFRTLNIFQNPSLATTTNWQNEIFRTAAIQNIELSASGGDARTQYYTAVNYFEQEGIIKGSKFSRLSGRINLDHRISDRFKFGTSLGFSRAVNSRINNDNNIFGVLSAALLNASDIPARRSDGSYAFDPASSTDNPLAQALEPTNLAINNRLFNNTFLQIDILPGLSFRHSWGLDYVYFREDRFIPTTVRQGVGANGQGDVSSAQEINWLNENVLTYGKSFGDHTISTLLGFSVQESRFERVAAQATNFPGNDIRRLAAGAVKSEATSTGTSWALTSYFLRANYDFKGKYLFTASIRADGSSRFSENNRYGVFPAASVGWRISEEGFMDNLTFVNELKLRGGIGVTGNQEIPNFGALGLFGGGANYLQLAGLAPTQIANNDLKWETTVQYSAGLDIGLFNRVNITADLFLKDTRDLLLNTPIPATSGFSTYLLNVGAMESRGIELGISASPLGADKAFQWTSDFNISFIRNKITRLADNVPPFAQGFASWVEVGQPLGTFRGYRVEGIFQSQEEINAANALNPSGPYQLNAAPGDIKFRDLNGDGRVTNDDQEILGNAQPDFFGGWTNTFRYKGFDLMIFLQYTYGNLIYNNTRAFTEGMNSVFGQTAGVLNRWTPTNTNTNVPRATFGDLNNNRRTSDRWLEDGSFLRVKNVVLGYNFSKNVTNTLKLRSLRLYASAQNLFTFTNYSGLDPEVNTFSGSNTALGTDFLTFPQARTYTFGINVGL